MASAAFLAAARESKREPVLLMAVESVTTLKAVSTTKADWDNAKADTNINTSKVTGEICLDTDGTEKTAGTYTYTLTDPYPDGVSTDEEHRISSSFHAPNSRVISVQVKGLMANNYATDTNPTQLILQYSTDNVNWTDADDTSHIFTINVEGGLSHNVDLYIVLGKVDY